MGNYYLGVFPFNTHPLSLFGSVDSSTVIHSWAYMQMSCKCQMFSGEVP